MHEYCIFCNFFFEGECFYKEEQHHSESHTGLLGYIIGRREQILKEVYLCSKEEFTARDPKSLAVVLILFISPEASIAEISETCNALVGDKYDDVRYGCQFCYYSIEPWTYVMVFWDTENIRSQAKPCEDVYNLYNSLLLLTTKE